MIISRSILLEMRNFSDRNFRENPNTFFTQEPFFFNCSIYEIIWKNMVEADRSRVTTKSGAEKRFACRITKAKMQTHNHNI
jgi:hypothetical protein